MLPSEPMISVSQQKSFWSRTFVGLRYRNFRLVWLGSVTEHTGEFMEIAAILWLVNELTHSPLWLTVVGSSRFISMIFSPFTGNTRRYLPGCVPTVNSTFTPVQRHG